MSPPPEYLRLQSLGAHLTPVLYDVGHHIMLLQHPDISGNVN